MGNEMVQATPVAAMVAQPTFDQVVEMAAAVAASRMFACQTKEQALTLMMLAQAENLHPIQAMRQFHIIQGRPSMRSDAMLARFQKAGGRIEWHHREDESAAASFSHPTSCPTPVRVEWTLAMAERAKLLGNDTWRKYPRQMLTARVISEGVRTVLPEVCVGLYTPEETEDMPAMPPPAPSKALPPVVRCQPETPPPATQKPHGAEGRAIDADGSDDAYAFDENFISGWRVTLMDRDFSEEEADKVLKGMLDSKNVSLGEVTIPQRHQLIAKAKAGAYDRHRPQRQQPDRPDELPDPCDELRIQEIAVAYAPEGMESPEALERFGGWLKTSTAKPWNRLSKDERRRVFLAVKAGEPWSSVPMESAAT